MSQIYKCDRCGNVFDIFSFNDNLTYSINYWGHNPNHGKTHVDLCNNCAKEFDRFLKGQACLSIISPVTEKPKCVGYKLLKKPTINYVHDAIEFDNLADAEVVLDKMKGFIEEYKNVSVGDMFELAGLMSPYGYRDYKYGWTNLNASYFIKTRNGWIIKLPPTVRLDSDSFSADETKEGDTDGDKYFE